MKQDVIYEFSELHFAQRGFGVIFRKFRGDASVFSFVILSREPPVFIVACEAREHVAREIGQILSDWLGVASARNRFNLLNDRALLSLIATDDATVNALK